MSAGNVCGLCLAMGAPLRDLEDSPLRDIYEKLTDISLDTSHRHVVACCRCILQLRKCHKLRRRSVLADKILTRILSIGKVVEEVVPNIDRSTLHLDDAFVVTPIEVITCPDVYSKDELLPFPCKQETEDCTRKFVDRKLEESDDDVEILEWGNVNIKSEVLVHEGDPNQMLEVNKQKVVIAVNIDKNKLSREVVTVEELNVAVDVNDEILIDDEDSDVEIQEWTNENELEKVKHTEDDSLKGAALAEKNYKTQAKTKDKTTLVPDRNSLLGKRKAVSEEKAPNSNEEAVNRKHMSENKHLNTEKNNDNASNSQDILTESATFKCQICPKEYPNEDALIRHMQFHTGFTACEICGRTIFKTMLLQHQRARHLLRIHACELCDYNAPDKDSLDLHKSSHTAEKYVCNNCGAAFETRSNLVRHLAKHQKKKNFECTICHKHEKTQLRLQQHLSKHRERYRYICPVCRDTFTNTTGVRLHLTRMHGVPREDQGIVIEKFKINLRAAMLPFT